MARHELREVQYKTPGNLVARATLHRRFGEPGKSWHRWAFDRITGRPTRARILEVGCGPGWLWRENADRIPADWRLTLSDFSPGMIEDTRTHLQRHHTHFVVADAERLPFAAEAFDAVVANHMLYHVPHRARAIAEFARVLAPGGRLYAATVGIDHMRELDRLRERFRAGGGALAQPWPTCDAADFVVGRGAAELGRSFAEVTLQPFTNLLKVTDAAALADYMLSTFPEAGEDVRRALLMFLQNEIGRDGIIEIRARYGLFTAQ
jgi:SAM-dependent methyltransferase